MVFRFLSISKTSIKTQNLGMRLKKIIAKPKKISEYKIGPLFKHWDQSG